MDLTAVTTNIIPTTNGSQNLGSNSNRFGTTYTNNVDIAGSVTGQIVPASTNGSQNIGSSSNRFGTAYTNNVDVTGSVVPATTNTANIGTSDKVFGNLHIKEITVRGNILPPEQNYPARSGGAEVSSTIQVNIGGPDYYFGSIYAKEIFTSGNTISLGDAELKSNGTSLTMPAGRRRYQLFHNWHIEYQRNIRNLFETGRNRSCRAICCAVPYHQSVYHYLDKCYANGHCVFI